MNVLNKAKHNQAGITLLEIVVAMLLFISLMLSVTRIFQLVIEGQRNAIASQNLQENMRYAFEIMGKEIRNAKANNGSCLSSADDAPTDRIYNTVGGTLYDEIFFINKDDQCVSYYIDEVGGIHRLTIDRDGATAHVTPNEIDIESLQFVVLDDPDPNVVQANVTFSIEASVVGKEMHKQNMLIQTTISSRYYPN